MTVWIHYTHIYAPRKSENFFGKSLNGDIRCSYRDLQKELIWVSG